MKEDSENIIERIAKKILFKNIFLASNQYKFYSLFNWVIHVTWKHHKRQQQIGKK